MKDVTIAAFFQSDYLGHTTLIQFPYLFLPSYKEWPYLHIDYFWKGIQHRVTIVASRQDDWGVGKGTPRHISFYEVPFIFLIQKIKLKNENH